MVEEAGWSDGSSYIRKRRTCLRSSSWSGRPRWQRATRSPSRWPSSSRTTSCSRTDTRNTTGVKLIFLGTVLAELEQAPDPARRPPAEEKLVVHKPNTRNYQGSNLSKSCELFVRLNRAQRKEGYFKRKYSSKIY